MCAIEADAELAAREASFAAVVFEREGETWMRRDANLRQTWYPVAQVRDLLSSTGFERIECVDAAGESVGPRGGGQG